jgi:hypothetical protein
VAADVRAGLLKDPGFGKVFTDHMVTIRWTQDRIKGVRANTSRRCHAELDASPEARTSALSMSNG